MPDTRFQIGEYYLSQHGKSPIWKATYYDGSSRQTRRVSLGTRDFQEAKQALAGFVVKNSALNEARPSDVPLALVLYRYWEGHAKALPSAEAAQIALALWTEFWGESNVAELSLSRQDQFVIWLQARGYKNSYVSRVLSVGRAAVRRAWKYGELASVPFIRDVADRSDEKEVYLLSPSEMARLIEAAKRTPHLYIFTMIMINTLARPDAVLDLRPNQINLKDRHITLNPKGRRQTKKFRPTVPITDTLLPFVRSATGERFVMWWDKPVGSIKGAFNRAVAHAQLPRLVTPYSLRHTMATELRRLEVPAWEVEGLLGHRRPGVTERYARYSPDYLSKGSRAIDAYLAKLNINLNPLT